MPKSKIHEQLENTLASTPLSPDNHDQVHIAPGLLNAESTGKLIHQLSELGGQVSGLKYVLGTTLHEESEKLIASNERVAASNESSAKWSKWLSIALIVTTLVVGLVQAYVLIWQTRSTVNSGHADGVTTTSPIPDPLEK